MYTYRLGIIWRNFIWKGRITILKIWISGFRGHKLFEEIATILQYGRIIDAVFICRTMIIIIMFTLCTQDIIFVLDNRLKVQDQHVSP